MRRSLLFAGLAALLAGYGLFVTQGFTFSPRYAAYDDAFNLYVMGALDGGGVRDQASQALASYAGDARGREYAYFSVYRLLLRYMTLDTAIKAVSLALALLTAFFFYRSAAAVLPGPSGGLWGGLLLLSLFLTMDTFYYGQNRAFGAALSAAWFWLVLSGRGWASPGFVGAFFPFYPYLSASAGIYSLLYPLLDREGFFRRRAAWAGLLLLSAAAVAFMYYGPDSARDNVGVFFYKTRSLFGERISPSDPLSALLYFVLNLDEHSRLFPLFVGLGLGLAALLRFARPAGAGAEAAVPGRLKWLGAAHAAAFVLLYGSNPFFASRQLIFFVTFALGLVLASLVRGRWGERGPAALGAGAAVIFLALNPLLGDTWDYSGYAGLCKRLSPGALAAGEARSGVLAGLPLFCGTPVYYSDQLSEVWLGRSPSFDFRGRKEEQRSAFCSESPGAVSAFAARRGITHFLVEPDLTGPACPGARPALLGLALDGRAPAGSGWRGRVYLVTSSELAPGAAK